VYAVYNDPGRVESYISDSMLPSAVAMAEPRSVKLASLGSMRYSVWSVTP